MKDTQMKLLKLSNDFFFYALLLLILSHCSKSDHCETKSEKPKISSPSSENGIIALDVFSQKNSIDLLLTTQKEKDIFFLHQRSLDGGKTWSPGVRLDIPNEKIRRPRRGDDPQIAAYGDHIAIFWTIPGISKYGSGPLATLISSDGGKTWTDGPCPSDDGSLDGHGFIDLAVDSRGTFHAVWLDSRTGEQGLRYSQSTNFGKTWKKNQNLDSKTCQCCWNRVYSFKPDLLHSIYRDRDPRDMALLAIQGDGKSWQRIGSVGDFKWEFNGCPHVGGALALTRFEGKEKLHALVWTGKEKMEGTYYLNSNDFGKNWSEAEKVEQPKGEHSDLVAEDSHLAMIWDGKSDASETWVVAKVSHDAGKTWGKAIQLSKSGAKSSYPRVVPAQGKFLAVWTEHTPQMTIEWKTKIIE